jgi:UPF0755 protein
VTESKPPPNGNDRTPAPQPAAPASAAEKAERGEAAAPEQPSIKSKPAPSGEAPRTLGVASSASTSGQSTSGQSTSGQSTSVAQNPRPAAAGAEKPRTRASERPSNGKGGARATAAAVSKPAPARAAVRAVPGAGEPYPALSARLVNGIGTAPATPKISKPITPRSPRTALEPDTVEMPTPRSKSARHPFVVIGNAVISIFVLVAIAAGIALVLGKQRFDAVGPLPEDRVVNIPRGAGIRDIADVLTHEGVIDQAWVFIGGVLVLKAREDLKAGEYQFKAHASLRDVVATIVEGRVVTHQFTIPEGLTSEQIVARLMDDDVLTGNIKEVPREGSLLPDTYNFARGLTREQMIQRMQQAQQRLVKEIWDRHSPDLPIKAPDQLVTLASLVEKETGKPEERTRVAAVFVNRLKQKMKLQSDPTIIYGLVGGKGTLGRPIMKSEIDQPTPYNTYQIDGLPPGPIANPGRASLEAAANPARTRELYFVADGSGGHAFAETYEQHQKNVARLRSLETDQKDQAPADAQSASSPPAVTPAAAPPAPAPSPPVPQRRRHSQNTQTTH